MFLLRISFYNMDTVYRDSLRRLFLDELLADKGWSDFVDLVLSNLDTSFLRLLSSEGFPYEFRITEFADSSLSRVGVKEVSDSYTVWTFNGGDVDDPNSVFIEISSEIEVVCENCELSVSGGPFSASGTLPVTDAAPASFSIRYLNNLPTGVLPIVRLNSLPDSVNPVYVDEFMISNRQVMSQNFAATSPALLWGVLSKLRIYPDISYRVYMESAGDSGYNVAYYSNYVRVLGVVEDSTVDNTYAYLVLGDYPLLSSLWDMFGTPSAMSSIIGYDKQFLVVASNALKRAATFVVSEVVDPSGSPFWISNDTLSISQQWGSFVIQVHCGDNVSWSVKAYEGETPADLPKETNLVITDKGQPEEGVSVSNAQYVVTANSELGDLTIGFIRDYQDLSIPGGPISKLVVEFNSSESAFTSTFPDLLPYVQNILSLCTPSGATAEIRFLDGSYTSSIDISDSLDEGQDWIKVNGFSQLPLSFDHSGGTSLVSVNAGSNVAWKPVTI